MKYTVKKGDTLSEIAEKYSVTVEALVASNGISNPDRIAIGQELTIPDTDGKLKQAFNDCLSAIVKMQEYKTLTGLLEED